MDNTGSFGAAIGGMTPELQAAVQRRAGTGATTSQVSNTAPTADPSTQVPPVPPIRTQPTASAATAGASPEPSLPFDSAEAKIILQAMSGRLKALSNVIAPKQQPKI